MPGKVPRDDLAAYVFERTGGDDDAVLQGPADGEDAAAIEWGTETLVVSSDPISLAASNVGRLGVPIACNDVAVSGGDPRWVTVVVLLPTDGDLDAITRDLSAAATDLGVAIVGGHSEYVDALERPTLSLTALGPAEEYVPTGGAQAGETLLLTKAAAIEGTAILAADFGPDRGVDPAVCDRGKSFLEEVSVVDDARVLRAYASSMHDPTEGGVLAGALEMARASGVTLEIDREAVPIRDETKRLCEAVDVDPLRIFGSGAVLASVPSDVTDDAISALASVGIDATAIGTVRDGDPGVDTGSEWITGSVEDDLYALWADA